MSDRVPGAVALDIVLNASHVRATHYRERAAQHRQMAAIEEDERLQANLLEVAARYDSLADEAAEGK